MRRRHLFDFGFPAATGTRLAGSYVLLAVARQSLRLSDARLERTRAALASAEERLALSRLACGYTRRLTHGKYAQSHQRIETGAGSEPDERTPGAQAHPA